MQEMPSLLDALMSGIAEAFELDLIGIFSGGACTQRECGSKRIQSGYSII